MSIDVLKRTIHKKELSNTDKVLLTLHAIGNPCSVKQIRKTMLQAGVRQVASWNISALLRSTKQKALMIDAMWELSPEGISYLNEKGLFQAPIIPKSNDLFHHEHFTKRTYIEKVVAQANGAYAYGLYDCAAAMSRRLFETLIIEVYEATDKISIIVGRGEELVSFENLISSFERDFQSKSANPRASRSTIPTLRAVKKLGDKSVHDRRYNATKGDLDKISHDMNAAAQDLLHLANLHTENGN